MKQNKIWEKKIEHLRRKFEELFLSLSALDSEMLNHRPSPERWSLLEVYEHLLVSFSEVSKGLPAPGQFEEQKRTLRTKLLFFVVYLILKLGVRVPVPATGMKPTGERSLEELRSFQDTMFWWLSDTSRSLSARELSKGYFFHPVCGPLNFSELLCLADIHFDSHEKKFARD